VHLKFVRAKPVDPPKAKDADQGQENAEKKDG
jgi:hypothetical protein